MKIIGMDLGTTNTYIYGCDREPDTGFSNIEPIPFIKEPISNASGSIATAVMYENGKPVLAGNVAESEFYTNLEAQPKRRIASSFKPEIAQGSPEAMEAMSDFLRILYEGMQGMFEEDTKVYVGMPALSREDVSVNMSACFINAGWPKPYFVRESDAALVSCLQSGLLDIEDVESRCLILDFGGGTCDYTCVENTDELQNGGDLLYGGRLFDDLFFQLFCKYDARFGREAPQSPYEWYVHWVECREEKEKFSRHVSANNEGGCSMHCFYYTADGDRRDAYIHGYTLENFIKDAEHYTASPQLLNMLQEYVNRGGLSAISRDLLEGREIGLISWLSAIFNQVSGRHTIRKVVLTGGSSRWVFTASQAEKAFTGAKVETSRKSFEDIAYGLALFPVLNSSHERVKKLLEQQVGEYTKKIINLTQTIINDQLAGVVEKCSRRIMDYDVLPVLEAASKQKTTIEAIETACAENIKNDDELFKIVEQSSASLSEVMNETLNRSFYNWLKSNGVMLPPNFVFPVQAVSGDFFNNINVKIARLDSRDLAQTIITKILPLIIGGAAAGLILHGGEPVTAAISGGIAYGASWFLARTAPDYLSKRALPKAFFQIAKIKVIAEKNRSYIERALSKNFDDIREKIIDDAKVKIEGALENMLDKLTIINQIKVNRY